MNVPPKKLFDYMLYILLIIQLSVYYSVLITFTYYVFTEPFNQCDSVKGYNP